MSGMRGHLKERSQVVKRFVRVRSESRPDSTSAHCVQLHGIFRIILRNAVRFVPHWEN